MNEPPVDHSGVFAVTQNDQLRAVLLEEMFSADHDSSRDTMHPSVSDLIGCLTKAYLNMHSPIGPGDQTKVYFLTGLGLERSLLAKRQTQQTAGEFDGVYYHLDNLDGGWFELKSTRMSATKGAEGYLVNSGHALRQMLSYAKTQGLLELDLGIIWLIPAKFEVYHITFTAEAVETNWKWVRIRRDVYLQAMDTGVPPEPFEWAEDWECKSCAYLLMCELRQKLEERKKEGQADV